MVSVFCHLIVWFQVLFSLIYFNSELHLLLVLIDKFWWFLCQYLKFIQIYRIKVTRYNSYLGLPFGVRMKINSFDSNFYLSGMMLDFMNEHRSLLLYICNLISGNIFQYALNSQIYKHWIVLVIYEHQRVHLHINWMSLYSNIQSHT